MSEFREGQRVLVAVDAGYMHPWSGFAPSRAAGQTATVRHDGLDRDGDVVLTTDSGKITWSDPKYVTLIDDEDFDDFEDEKDEFKPGDRVRVTNTDSGEGNPVEFGEYGTVVEVDNYVLPGGERVIYVKWDKGNQCGLFDYRLEKVEDEDYLDAEGLAALRGEDDEPVGEMPAASLTGEGLFIRGPLSFTVMDETVDVVNHPPHYGGFSNGAEVIDITENLTFNGGNAVKYVARSTRKDGRNKGNVLEDLRKARWYIDREIERIESQ